MNAAAIAQLALAAFQVANQFVANYEAIRAAATTEDQATLDAAYKQITSQDDADTEVLKNTLDDQV